MDRFSHRIQPPGGYATRDHPPDHIDSLPPGSNLGVVVNYIYKASLCIECEETPCFEDSSFCEECAKELL